MGAYKKIGEKIQRKIMKIKNKLWFNKNGEEMYNLARVRKLLYELRLDKAFYHDQISYIEEQQIDEKIRSLEIELTRLNEESKLI